MKLKQIESLTFSYHLILLKDKTHFYIVGRVVNLLHGSNIYTAVFCSWYQSQGKFSLQIKPNFLSTALHIQREWPNADALLKQGLALFALVARLAAFPTDVLILQLRAESAHAWHPI